MKVEIPDKIYKKLKKRSKEMNFDSVNEYIKMILKEVVKKTEKESKTVMDKKEEEEVKERLKTLGYI